MRTFRSLVWTFALVFAVAGGAQTHRQVPGADQQNSDFGTKFFDDLRNLFGELRQSELDKAFQRANAIRCSDLSSGKGEWKEVAFLNDDRDLGDWHFDTIDQVKGDLASLVFSGSCFDDQSTVKVATSYPVQETLDRFQEGKLPFSEIVISDNDPVSVLFNRSTNAYTFLLPYLYLESRHSSSREPLYTLTPPLTTSQPDRTVAEEFRCKALSDPELTYRFLLCRTRVVNRDPQIQRQVESQQRQLLGNAAYYILSDGKEASSSVKLTFDRSVDTPSPPAETKPPDTRPDTRTNTRTPATETTWKPATASARLVDVGQNPFRLRFNPRTWSGRIDSPQLLAGQKLSDLGSNSLPDRNKEYCTWRPDSRGQVARLLEPADDTVLFTLSFKKELQSVSSAVFDAESYPGIHVGTLQCFFPQNDTPATITAARFSSIAGDQIALEIRPQ